jgi:phenylalanine-4-hydroxylase
MFTEFDSETRSAPARHAARPHGDDDWTVPQLWEHFSAAEHKVWDTLFARQQGRLSGRVVRAFADGLDLLHLSRPGIPEFGELNDRLFPRTGWTVVAVPGLLPDEVFFRFLSERRFPAGNFIRDASQLDYIEEPDVFHDVFGHVPILADHRMADYMHRLGELGAAVGDAEAMHRLSRLYWYTVEFGLARAQGRLEIYGAGLASSFGEAGFALESPEPERHAFELEKVLRAPYRSDRFQSLYFVAEGLDALIDGLMRRDLAALIAGKA